MSRPLTILVVEDEALIALNLVSLLEDLGHFVVGPAASAAQALALAERTPPDLAFVDINLVDGPTGAGVARDHSGRFGTLVTVVSATPGGLREGADIVRIIRKPYSDQLIQEAIEHAKAASRPPRREPSRRDEPSGSLATLSRAVAND